MNPSPRRRGPGGFCKRTDLYLDEAENDKSFNETSWGTTLFVVSPSPSSAIELVGREPGRGK